MWPVELENRKYKYGLAISLMACDKHLLRAHLSRWPAVEEETKEGKFK